MAEEKLINEMTERTGKLCKNRIVLAIQDTSEINLTSHRNRLKPNTGLGRLDDAKGNIGFKLHPTLAVDADTLRCNRHLTDGALLWDTLSKRKVQGTYSIQAEGDKRKQINKRKATIIDILRAAQMTPGL